LGAWDHIEKIGRRSTWAPEAALITGAGPIGLLAALLSVQRGYRTYVLDLATEGRKPDMVRRLGASYVHPGELADAAAEVDIVIECTGHVQMLHFQLAASALAMADPDWLAGLITRRVPLGQRADDCTRDPGDIKTVLEFSGPAR
jgi:glucose 1-dehydrogenase